MNTNGDQPATKGDLDRFATKTDLDRFALKTDLDRFASKTDAEFLRLDAKIDSATSRLAKEIVALQVDVREIRETMATKNDVDRILAAVESFAGKAQVYDRAAVLHGSALTEAQVTLLDHEKRLRSIETRPT
jgi:hypothetical protein